MRRLYWFIRELLEVYAALREQDALDEAEIIAERIQVCNGGTVFGERRPPATSANPYREVRA